MTTGNDGQSQDRSRTISLRIGFRSPPPGAGLALLLIACAAPAQERPAAAAPSAYPGTCTLVGIEEVTAPVGQQSDTIALVARYRFGGESEPRKPFALQFEIARTRAHDLRQHLAAHSTVVCRPDVRSAAAAPEIELAPFEGQAGQPLRQ